MQQQPSLLPKILIALAVLVIAGLCSLMLVNIPAPQKPVEKELDAKTFLAKPQA